MSEQNEFNNLKQQPNETYEAFYQRVGKLDPETATRLKLWKDQAIKSFEGVGEQPWYKNIKLPDFFGRRK